MAQTTRDQLLATARRLFAERGFYGVSIANIADEHGLTKQALLHHFPNKAKLYGEVLREISDDLDKLKLAAMETSADPKGQLGTLLRAMVPTIEDETIRTRLLMRELLDNVPRAETAGTWYLKTFLNDLVGMVKAVPGWAEATEAEALAVIYQLLGAVNYFGVSGPTLQGIFGKTKVRMLNEAFPAQLDALLDAAFAIRHSKA
ncbi:MAG: TetR/AcrR family transcriptional regulator [Pseudomonadota bacterium]